MSWPAILVLIFAGGQILALLFCGANDRGSRRGLWEEEE